VCEHGGVEVVEVELIEPPQGSMGIFAETIARIEEDLRKLLGGKR
jgi:hypothetical protein